MRVQSAAVFAIAMVPVIAAGQQFLPNFGPPVDPDTRFEVVAIKAFDQGSGGILMRMTPGRFDSTVPVGTLLRQALQKPDYQPYEIGLVAAMKVARGSKPIDS